MSYETILVERDGRVGTITLNRPKALNALNSQVMNEVTTAAAMAAVGADSLPMTTGEEEAVAVAISLLVIRDLSGCILGVVGR